MGKPFFITTAIDYTNGAPHIGHAYEKVLADVLARYQRLKDGADGKPQEVFFLTGVDQHGQKVQQSADKAGVEPQEFVDGITAKFKALWEKLDVRYDAWAATTDALHKECVRANLQMLWDDKDPATGGSRWIYKKTQRGFYSVRQEQFLTDKERGPDGQFGPEWGLVEERDEENFYFRLTQDPATGLPGCDPKQWLLDFIDKRSADGKPFVVPDFRVAELRNAVEKLEGDLCISRPASRLKWGIPFPESFGAGFVTYVWFDALVNYISFVPGHDPNAERGTRNAESESEAAVAAAGPGAEASPSAFPVPRSAFAALWPPLHVIGKDILIPAHGVYWPIMLKALGFADGEMPTLLVHGWWNIAGAKMSKSLGNIVDPDLLADKYGPEALRYYLMSDIATGKDADFSEERLVGAYNAALANSLGNLLNRTLSMAGKYREGKVRQPPIQEWGTHEPTPTPAPPDAPPGIELMEWHSGFDAPGGKVYPYGYENSVKMAVTAYTGYMSDFAIQWALEQVAQRATAANQLVDTAAPWILAKDQTERRKAELDIVLYMLAESLRIIAILISPVLPDAAHGIFDQLNWKMDETGADRVNAELRTFGVPASAGTSVSGATAPTHLQAQPARKDSRFRLADAVWGGLPDGHVLGKPVPLFPRIEAPKAE